MGERKSEVAEALSLGGAIHKVLEDYYLGIKDGKVWELGEVRSLLKTTMESYEIPFTSKENEVEATEQHMGMMEGLVCGTNNLHNLLNDCEVVDCEKEFQYRFPLDFDIVYKNMTYNEVYIIGSIDMIIKDKNGGLIAIDFKSSRKIFDNPKIKKNLQLPIYSLVIQDIYGRLPVQTLYYFTRLDAVQEKPVIKEHIDECERVYFKSGQKKGQLKEREACVQDIKHELMCIFELQYATGMNAYKPTATPLCSWCNYGIYHDDSCEHSYKYERKDLLIPDGKEHYFKGYR